MDGRASSSDNAPGQRASAPAGSTGPNLSSVGANGGGVRRNSVSDGAESLSRSASDSSVAGKPGGRGANSAATGPNNG